MKTKIKRHSRSVISVVLALCLLLTSSVAVMFVANAVTIPNEKVGAKVVEEGEVGATTNDDEQVGANLTDDETVGDGAVWLHWANSNMRSAMSNKISMASAGGNTRTCTLTSSGNTYFIINDGENDQTNSWIGNDITIVNNLTSINGSAWANVTDINDGSLYYLVQYWCSSSNRAVDISFDMTPNARTITLEPSGTDVCSSVSIATNKATVTSNSDTFNLTAEASSVASALSGKSLTYTFYDDTNRVIGTKTSSTGSAVLEGLTQSVRTKKYKVTVSYSGYLSKTSSQVTVTNSSVVEPAFNLLNDQYNWTTGSTINKVDSAYGANIYYIDVDVTSTANDDETNRFRLKSSTSSTQYFPTWGQGGNSNACVLPIDGEPFTPGETGTSTSNYFVFNPPTTGTYRIYVDQTNTSSPKVWVQGERDIFITSKTTFNNYVTTGADGHTHVKDTDVDAFESDANTGFVGYKSGNIWKAASLTSPTPFMISTIKGVEYDREYSIRNDLCTGVTFTQDHIRVGDEEDGEYAQIFYIQNNVVNSNKYTKNIILHIDKARQEIWATSTFDQTDISSGSTTAQTEETVRYYFAVTDADHDAFVSDNKLHVYYWNNSLTNADNWRGSGNYYGSVAATPVNSSGSTESVTDKVGNKIYVDLSKPAAYTINDSTFTYTSTPTWGTTVTGYNATAYIYCADIPVWATSFTFADSNGVSYIQYTNEMKNNQRGIVLNPNRVYVAFNYGSNPKKYYIAGVRLDQSLWTPNSAVDADEASKFIKTFKTNLIKYTADSSSDVNPAMNKALRNEYASRGIANELYFGNFHTYQNSVPAFSDSVKPVTWKVWNNLAQRGVDAKKFAGNNKYYASVWDLAGNVLDKSRTNNLGGYMLTDTYQKDVLPFFDYDTLSTSGNGFGTVYKNVDFPFYKTTYQGITSYSYDSMSDYNREYDTSTGKYTYTGYKALNNMQGYQPFSDQDESFANEFDIDFYMTPTGCLKDSAGNNHDISFNFSGDDDVWVYIDGVKVLDLGGAHMISAGSINLTDMKAYYKTPAMSTTNSELDSCTEFFANSATAMYTVDLAKLFELYGVDFNNNDATTQHKLQMFYVERGQNESNCSISFNLPQNSGLRIQNEIDTSGVNAGLVAATLSAADKDYFSYYVENKKATSEQRNTALSQYSLTNIPAVATGLRDNSFYTTTPHFPATNDATVKRKNDLLLLTGGLTGTASDSPTLSGDIFGLTGLNYSLTDAYATGTINDTLSGRVLTKSGTNGVNLNLLYGQSATFNNKITPHTWLVVKQENKLYNPTNDGSTMTRSANTVDTGVAEADQRNASRFYSTTYTIKDDSSGKLLNTVTSVNNMEEDVVTHAKGETAGTYFSNYSDITDADENVAATFKFVNKPHTGTIQIKKVINAGSQEPNLKASFEFTIQFKDIFGIETAKFDDYDVKYRVYNADGSFVDRTYFATSKSILLRHGQYAEILGIPAGTKYQIKEKERSQYELESIKKDSYRSGELKKTVVYTNPTDFTKPSDIDYLSKNDSGNYLADFIFTNKKVSFKVVLHYYDRKMQNGVPVDIDTEPTEASITYAEAPGEDYEAYKETEDDQELLWIDTEKYIANAVEGKLGNVVDDYFYWTTNTKARTGIQTHNSISYSYNKTTGSYDETLTPYVATDYHLDAYGKPLSNPQNSDKWITYYDNQGIDLTTQFTDEVINSASGTTETYKSLYQQLARVDVWVFNEPKKYTVTVYGAADSTELTDVNGDGSVMVGNGGAGESNTGSITDYYNTRFGETAGAGSPIDGSSHYMQQYGRLTSFTGQYPTDLANVQRVIGDYKFVGWATDSQGKNIYTNDYYCGYRILSDMSLYPVYMKNPTADFGLTITPNVKDTYIASNGTEYTRLNVTYNPYNVTGDNDTNITEIAMVNIRMADTFSVNQIDLNTVRTKVKDALDALQNSNPSKPYGAHTITVTVTDKNNPNTDITKPVRNEYNTNELNYLVTFDTPADNTVVKLNNKNRVMLTQTYNSSLLATGQSCNKLLCLGAMKYHDDSTNTDVWTISNNYLYYEGGVCK